MNSSGSIRVVLADDHTIFREGLRALLADERDILVVGESSSGDEVVEVLQKLLPDLVVMDIAMPGLNGLQATRIIKSTFPGIRVLILSMSGDGNTVREAFRIGVEGYLVKETAASELINAIREIAMGGSYISPVIARLYAQKGGGFTDVERPHELTPREREVLQLIATSMTNKEIGVVLGISHKTVDRHRQLIMSKLDIHNIAGLTRYAIAQGLLK